MVTISYKSGTESAPFSQREFDKFERMLRVDTPEIRFDDEYIEFIRSQNGGEPVQKFFPVEDAEWMPIDRILNFADFESSPLIDQLLNVHQVWNAIEDRLSPGMFPFAALPGGDFLIFDCGDSDEPDSGGVALWYHERSTEESPSLTRIAGSFSEFASMLRDSPP